MTKERYSLTIIQIGMPQVIAAQTAKTASPTAMPTECLVPGASVAIVPMKSPIYAENINPSIATAPRTNFMKVIIFLPL